MMTELDRELLFWKNLLGLNSWEIKAEFVHSSDVYNDSTSSSRIFKGDRAHIKIVRMADREIRPIEDWRMGLIRELVHISLWALGRALRCHQDELVNCDHRDAERLLARVLYLQKYRRHWEGIGWMTDTPGDYSGPEPKNLQSLLAELRR